MPVFDLPSLPHRSMAVPDLCVKGDVIDLCSHNSMGVPDSD